MVILLFILSIMLVLNIVFAFAIIFLERKNPTSTWLWLIVLLLIPNVGFVLYLILGQDLSKRKMFRYKTEEDQLIGTAQLEQLSYIKNNCIKYNDESMTDYQDIIHMHLINSQAVFSQDNEVEIFTDGKKKFDSLLDSIEKAESFIHMQYYIIKNDDISKKVIDALTKKAKEGLEVRFLYDEVGGRHLPKSFFNEFKKAGGKVASFFPSRIPFINLRINYRNHRKIAIIDGNCGYIGGFNIGDEYLGLNERFGYWRDTHLKIMGSSVHMMHIRFIQDWRYASKEDIGYLVKYYPNINSSGTTGIQIVSSGPDSKEDQIKNGYIKMILSAKKSIYIQTPYFVPDDSMLDALRIAALSGVDIRIMFPNKPDHMFVYWATLSYIGELLKYGVKAYIYQNGFIHAKTIVVDGKLASVGTANIDVRSFTLNFEANAFIYDTSTSTKLNSVFEEDMSFCSQLTYEMYLTRSNKIKFKESISRLLSPIL